MPAGTHKQMQLHNCWRLKNSCWSSPEIPGGAIGHSFAVELLLKRGRSLVAERAEVSSVWPCSWAFCPSKGVTFQEGAGAWETKPAARKPGSPVPPYSSSRESRESWTSMIWWEESWLDKDYRISSQKSGILSFSFLEIVTRGGKWGGGKDFITSVRYPKESFLGCSHRGARSISSYSAIWGTRSTTFKMGVSRGTENYFFPNFPYLLQSANFHYYHKAVDQIIVLGGAFGKLFSSPLFPDEEVESSYICHFTLQSGFWSQGCFNV